MGTAMFEMEMRSKKLHLARRGWQVSPERREEIL